jgi:hypothetical protein
VKVPSWDGGDAGVVYRWVRGGMRDERGIVP